MSVYSALIFDLDGTLIDSASDIAKALNVGFALNDWPELDPAHVETFLGNGPRRLIVDILEDLAIPYDDAQVQRAFDGYLHAYMEDPAGCTRFFPHVREDLAALRQAGIRLGICTNKNHAVTGKVLEQLGLADLFEVALGADAVPACKPDPGHLLAVAQAMDLASDEWAYVGDTRVDQMTAYAAGVPFFVVPWGGGPHVDISAEQRLNRLADLLQRSPLIAKERI
ncbi:phosphoglycolate phosphatase [Pseudomonas gingeri NCPPB 3146 = LMG 5327]|uniref:HAD-IA family hydrolase n=2 Tax=Pseudomonas gingeri TaxID=117681 RepID=A0A7Y7XXQ8_9PSED|nr:MULTISPECIES: HAD-IA family hydrolase [Pseudomonas]NWC13936.1 HAD-IA family hydrolase [Pseudomonas gingeri]NWE48445.1 HAD-IA family hydrolase [Pseudomonas gingeri]NWE72802.1 HAD-IA family hydrolase [Pseudomonas gingeri]PNQ88863.1 phosphoglycolate phosphatase [Pseudomonas gingeri NCPPB 3146 = LMG 5327]BBP76696.1 phosphoglycolate phosphatase [Pseudomonas sp. Ost2]